MRVRLGRPRDVLGWALVIGAFVGFLGAGPTHMHPSFPFFGLFGEQPLGMPRLGWLAIGTVLVALRGALQISRGEVETIDDDPTITLNLSDAGPDTEHLGERSRKL